MPDAPAAADAARIAELSEKARTIVNAFSDNEPAYTRDGAGVVFISNRDGLGQLYLARLDRPADAPTRLTHTNERVTGPIPLADGNSILYRSDRGADENWSIFKVGLDGGKPVDLTPGEKLQRDEPIVPHSMPDTMYYSARKMAEPASTLYAQKIAPDSAPRRIYGESSPGFLLDVSADGKQALWLRNLSISEGHVMLVDLGSGAARELYPGEARKVRVSAAAFAADGKRVFITSDDGGDQALLLALDLSGKETARYVEKHPATALLVNVCPSMKDDRLAVTVGAGDHYELRVLDAKTLQPGAPVKLPAGSGSTGACPSSFSPDGKRLLLSWSTPQSPSDLLSVDVGAGRASTLRAQTAPWTREPSGDRCQRRRNHRVRWRPDPDARLSPARRARQAPGHRQLPRRPGGRLDRALEPSRSGSSPRSATRTWSPTCAARSGYGRAFEEGDNGRKRLDAFKDIEIVGALGRRAAVGGQGPARRLRRQLRRLHDAHRAHAPTRHLARRRQFVRRRGRSHVPQDHERSHSRSVQAGVRRTRQGRRLPRLDLARSTTSATSSIPCSSTPARMTRAYRARNRT